MNTTLRYLKLNYMNEVSITLGPIRHVNLEDNFITDENLSIAMSLEQIGVRWEQSLQLQVDIATLL